MPDVNVDEVVTTLKKRVAERRAAGDYPIGLEQQLESEFLVMMNAIERDGASTARLRDLAESVVVAAHDMNVGAPSDSRFPGGSAAHNASSRVVSRHVNPLAESVRDLGVSVAEALEEIRRLFETQAAADERQLLDVFAAVTDRLAVIDHLVELTTDIERRLTRLESEHHDS